MAVQPIIINTIGSLNQIRQQFYSSDISTAMENKNSVQIICDTINNTFGIICPSCESTHYVKNGKENNIQRYRCKKCNKNFRSTTSTPIHCIHKKHLLMRYLNCMHKSFSIRKAAKTIGISTKTAFIWRHKILSSFKLNEKTQLNPQKFLSLIKLPYSEKGNRQPNTHQNNKPKCLSIIIMDSLSQFQIHKINFTDNKKLQLLHLTENTYLQNRDKSIPRAFKSALNKKTSDLQPGTEIKKAIKQWLDKFRGVATKYLQNYWQWYMLSHKLASEISPDTYFLHHSINKNRII